MNPVGGASGSRRSSRPRGQSVRSQADGLEDAKILEEASTDAGALRPHDRGDDSLSDEDLHDDEETALTTKDKLRKGRKKRRNTLLDQRIVRESITAEEKRQADQNVMKKSLVNITLIGLWYLFSLSISIVSCTLISPTKET
jgi:solute carrier family 35 protein C2